jgi:photosystem II cytochrome c550
MIRNNDSSIFSSFYQKVFTFCRPIFVLLCYVWTSIFMAFGGELGIGIHSAAAEPFTREVRTVPYNSEGFESVLSLDAYKRGKRLFNNACATCHVGGVTKTNQNVGLDIETLRVATPSRDNVQSLVEYMKNPMTLDNTASLSETHPNTSTADLFPKMRSLSETDLEYVAGYILIQSKVQRERWGGGKVYY